ncbi:5'-nucleotidase /3'-nucleotidase /exopolyphosphatase [Arthrobacter subterraneus]|uniref:5'-nucleotidase n=1 Tax=Arthrobacter subterraneus TaxID=335973 RepID=A0A1G8P4P8_9MICC|nr:5'/3'-nucleotidase SurE [Arthrobacter subterraneus]SDI87469.1 5'-nucleotidase /3'-nucleotidase /exopolyphosphatase [Arthrobacter subterraneus]
MTTPKRVLVTNDDGIKSPGLHALAAELAANGHEVTIAAPAAEYSGSSASILAVEEEGRIRVEERTIEGLESVPAFAVSGAPGFISMIAANGAFGDPPDVVFSGVNRGANVGRAILHSGTVGAALTAGINGGRGMAVSLDTGLSPTNFYWKRAARMAVDLLPALLKHEPGTVLNLNVPNRNGATPAEYRVATLAEFGIVQATLAERGKQYVRLSVEDTIGEADEQSDFKLLVAGYAPVTAITAVTEAVIPSLQESLPKSSAW